VIASEDGDFLDHDGIDWTAIESARTRNAAAEARAQALQIQAQRRQKQAQERAQRRLERLQKAGRPIDPYLQALAGGASGPVTVQPRLVGASTISQQLAKNLFLSGERTCFAKRKNLHSLTAWSGS
jgi:monofunctional biosynthetic peptidoglycan transglycosylase